MDEIQTLLATLPIYLGSQYKPAYPTTEPATSTENDALLRAVGAAKDELRRVKEEKQKEEATRTMKRVELNNKMEESLREEKMNQEKRKVLSAAKPSFLSHLASPFGNIIHIEDISNHAIQSMAFLVFTDAGIIEYWDTIPLEPTVNPIEPSVSPDRSARRSSTFVGSRKPSFQSMHATQNEVNSKRTANQLTLHDFFAIPVEYALPIVAVVRTSITEAQSQEDSAGHLGSSSSIPQQRKSSISFSVGRKSLADGGMSRASRQNSISGLGLLKHVEQTASKTCLSFFVSAKAGTGGMLHWEILDRGDNKQHQLRWDSIEFLPSPATPMSMISVTYSQPSGCIVAQYKDLLIAYEVPSLHEKYRVELPRLSSAGLCSCPNESRVFVTQAEPPLLLIWAFNRVHAMRQPHTQPASGMTILEEADEDASSQSDEMPSDTEVDTAASHHSGNLTSLTQIVPSFILGDGSHEPDTKIVFMQPVRTNKRHARLMLGLSDNTVLLFKDGEVKARLKLPPIEEVGVITAGVCDESFGICVTDRGQICTFSVYPLTMIPSIRKDKHVLHSFTLLRKLVDALNPPGDKILRLIGNNADASVPTHYLHLLSGKEWSILNYDRAMEWLEMHGRVDDSSTFHTFESYSSHVDSRRSSMRL